MGANSKIWPNLQRFRGKPGFLALGNEGVFVVKGGKGGPTLAKSGFFFIPPCPLLGDATPRGNRRNKNMKNVTFIVYF